MNAEEIVRRFKALAIRSNLAIMSTTLREEQFISLLENIRSERDWRHVRAYLTAIEEYSAYLPQNQKGVILEFLFDMLSHKDGDIRRQAAGIAGILIAGYEINFTKEIPVGYRAPKVGDSLETNSQFICKFHLGHILCVSSVSYSFCNLYCIEHKYSFIPFQVPLEGNLEFMLLG